MVKIRHMQNQTELVGTTEACQILDVDDSTLSRWSDERLQPDARKIEVALRLHGRTGAKLFRRSDVEALAERLRKERQAS